MTEDLDDPLARAERYVLGVERLFAEQLALIEHLAQRGGETGREEERLREMQHTLGAVDLDWLRGRYIGPTAKEP